MEFPVLATHFGITEPFVSSEEVYAGNINRTFIATFGTDGQYKKFVFQRINTFVFKNPCEVMNNILNVTEFIKQKLLKETGSYERRVLSFLCCNGLPYYRVEGQNHFWRAYEYVDEATAYDMVQTPEQFFEAGRAFGELQGWLSDFPAETLFETIPNFHNTPMRFQNFRQAVERDEAGRRAEVQDEIEFLLSREGECGQVVNALSTGVIPWRVTHNDTKINNILFDNCSNRAICVIDLDTVMPGSSLYDFGDAVRYGASTAAEDERDLSKVSLDVNLYEQFTHGFLQGSQGLLSEKELDLLLPSVRIMTLELAVRFLEDYLNGDKYFKTTSPDHNLVRARTQIRLAQDIESKWEQLKTITDRCRAE